MDYLSANLDEAPTPEQLWEAFPNLCCPDLSDPKLAITEDRIIIHDDDCEWAVQSDLIMADGGGTMIFKYKGTPTVTFIAAGEQYVSSLPNSFQRLMATFANLEIIERSDEDGWVFKGTCHNNVKFEIEAKVTSLAWVYDEN